MKSVNGRFHSLNGKLFRASFLFALVLLSGFFAGCSKRYHDLPVFSAFPIRDYENGSVGRFKTSYLADQIHAYYRGNTNGPIGVATFVDIDNLYGSSTFGRMLSEQLMSELTMRGYNVIEMRQAAALQVMFGQGEFGLSQEVNILKPAQDLSGLVVGTYVASPERVYLNARLIDPASSVVISAGSVEMDKTPEIARLIRGSSMPATLERIPVKHLGYATQVPANYWPYMPPVTWGPNKQRYEAEEGYYIEEPKTNSTDVPAPLNRGPKKAPDPVL